MAVGGDSDSDSGTYLVMVTSELEILIGITD